MPSLHRRHVQPIRRGRLLRGAQLARVQGARGAAARATRAQPRAVVEREKARMRRDFSTADAIREELFKVGVEVWESHGERMWRARDGRSGPRPNHEGRFI